MKNPTGLTVALILIAAGVFPAQAHGIVDLCAWAIGGAGVFLASQGATINMRAVETLVTLGVVVIVILALAGGIDSLATGIKNRKRR